MSHGPHLSPHPLPLGSTAPARKSDERDPSSELAAEFPGLELSLLPAEELPEPYRSLLAHEQDMTSTLGRFHAESLVLEVLSQTREAGLLHRTVLLVGASSGLPRELGAIAIHLERFAAAPRQEILACRKPLGAILGEHGIPYRSRPEGFLALQSTPNMRAALRLGDVPGLLYGRRNALRTPAGDLLADVLEILPAVREDPAGEGPPAL